MKFFRSEKKKRREELIRRNPQLMAGQDAYTFRRSRTLTGSASSSIKAANESQAQIKSPRLKAHELRQHRRRMLLGLLGCLLLAAGTYWLMNQFVAQVTAINYTPSPNVVPDKKVYTEVIQSYFRTRPFERFRFALDETALTKYMQSKRPEVATIKSISGDGIGAGTVSLELRQPVVGWKVGNRQYYVDDGGAPFRENYYNDPKVIINDQSGITPEVSGGAIASNRFLSFLGRVVTLAKEMQLGRVTTVTIPPGVGTRTVEVNLEGRGMPVRMHIDRDPAAQVEDAKRALAYLDSRGIKPRYVDVRVAGKAFYRD